MSTAMTPIELWLDRWELEADGEAIECNGADVALVRRGDVRAVLKVLKPGSDEALARQCYPTILRWAFAQAVLSALWHVEDGDEDQGIAAAMRSLLPG